MNAIAMNTVFFFFFFLFFLGLADAAIVEHAFRVGNLSVTTLCEERVVTAVNGRLPGPAIEVKEGDTLVVNVTNESPHDITIHWHGIFQLLSAWADGPDMITQCPIRPGRSYTYRFNITGQEGTLWWHAHSSLLRATVYGALLIRPLAGRRAYPFPRPDHEVPLLLGEWWNGDVVDLENQAFLSGTGPRISDAYTINGKPGALYYSCSNGTRPDTYKLKVVQGETYLLRIINAAVNNQLFFKIAGHKFTVVAVDASYTKPYETDVVVLAPGHTVDALMTAGATPGNYYMAASPYISTAVVGVPRFDNTTTTGIVEYSTVNASSPPVMPVMPAFGDTPAAHQFYTNLTGLVTAGQPTVPLDVDEHMFITFGLGRSPCLPSQTLCNNTTMAIAASMNNVSFQFPFGISLLEAYSEGRSDVYTTDFPDNPPVVFDYVNASRSVPLQAVLTPEKATKLKKLKYNSTVEIVLQDTAVLGIENHPIHLHGFNFFVLAQGFGNYDAAAAAGSFNLVDPQARNTIAVPTGGWAVIRFVANNPGIWFMHCHLDSHMPIGLGMAFEVANGPDAASTLPPPPPDFPTC